MAEPSCRTPNSPFFVGLGVCIGSVRVPQISPAACKAVEILSTWKQGGGKGSKADAVPGAEGFDLE